MNSSKAMILMTASMAAFAASDATIKLAARTLPATQILALTAWMSLAIFLVLLRSRKEPLFTRQVLHRAVLIRTAGEVIGSAGFVIALALVPLAIASALLQAQPLAVTLGAAIFLGERVGWRRWSAVAAGFVGVLIILRPGVEGFDPNALWTLLAIFGLTARDLGSRVLPPSISTPYVSAWALICLGSTFTLGGLLFDTWRAVSLDAFLYLALSSVAVSAAFLLITTALRIGEVSAIAPFRYTRMIFALAIAILVFGERIDAATWIGTGIVIASGLYAFWRERRAVSLA